MTRSPIVSDERAGEAPGAELSPAEEKFELWRKRSGAILAPLTFLLVYWLTRDAGLTPAGRTLSSILAFTGVLWITEFLPLPVAALLGAVLCVVTGVGEPRKVLAYFADPIVFVFIGSFMIAQAMSVHGLDRRIALNFLSLPFVGSSRAGMLAGLGLITAIISMWVSNTATTAMMLPIALGVLSAVRKIDAPDETRSVRNWPFATGVMLMIAYSASIGGIGTPVGSPPNLIGIGLIRKATGVDIGFFKWMALCVPLLVVMFITLFLLLYFLHRDKRRVRPTTTSAGEMMQYVRSQRSALPPISRGEINTLLCFLIAVTLWVLPGVLSLPMFKSVRFPWEGGSNVLDWFNKSLGEPIVAMIAACLLFALPIDWKQGKFTLTWEQGVKIDWGTILLFGGGLAMGGLMFDTGVAEAMGRGVVNWLGISSLWSLTFLSICLAMLLSESASNTASANMIIPVIIAIAQAANVSPLPPALGAVLGASYGFMLPVSTPPNAVVYSSGYVPIQKMMRAGILFDLIGIGVIWCGLYVLCPRLGLM